jgi:hypothetical protein
MLEYAVRELLRRKRRTVAHTAGYALAAAVIALVFLILYNGQSASDAILRGTGTHFAAFAPLCASESCGQQPLDAGHEGFYSSGVKSKPLPHSILELARSLDAVADVAPFLLFRLHNDGAPIGDFDLGGVPLTDSRAVATNSCTALDVTAGRFLTTADSGAVVLEQAFAESRLLAAGGRLRVAGRDYAIVGVVNTGIRVARADVYLPLEEARAVINTRLRVPLYDEANLILVESKSAGAHETAVAQVKRLLGANASVLSYNCWQPASQAMGITNTSAFLIALTVFVCLLAFSLQSQYARVAERRYDIGILKSIGWSRAAVSGQIVAEAIIQAFAGWAIGSLIALAVFAFIPSASLVGTQALVIKEPFPAVFLVSLLAALAGGTVAGFLPGFFAASFKPADALRRL